MLLQEFRNELLNLYLQFLWRQWSALGVAGYGESGDNWVIDPEALLLFSASMARYDQRLFDEILDWLSVNERFINVQRLKVVMKKEDFQSASVIHAISGEINNRRSDLKWRRLAEKESPYGENKSLFFLKSGKPMPVGPEKDPNFLEYGFIRNPVENREMSKAFPLKKKACLLLQLRGLMGVNSRSEILLYLLLNQKGTIQEIATQNYYSWKSVQDVLFELGRSSVVHFPEAKRGRVYYIDPEPWFKMLLDSKEENIQWICWPALLRCFEIIWFKINEENFTKLSGLEQAAEVKLLMEEELIQRFDKAGFAMELGQLSGVWGEEYLERWLNTIKGILG